MSVGVVPIGFLSSLMQGRSPHLTDSFESFRNSAVYQRVIVSLRRNILSGIGLAVSVQRKRWRQVARALGC